MATYYRRDEDVTDGMGNPVSGVQIALATQPANTTSFPPTPAVKLYADALGTPLRVNPPQTDAYGHAEFYTLPGLYTVCYYSTQIATPTQMLVLQDQVVAAPAPLPTQFNSDSSTAGTITPLPDGFSVKSFNLSGIPHPAQSLVFCVNGIVQTGYNLVFATVSLLTAPPLGSLITATYQT
jgi:hypothetical protein